MHVDFFDDMHCIIFDKSPLQFASTVIRLLQDFKIHQYLKHTHTHTKIIWLLNAKD